MYRMDYLTLVLLSLGLSLDDFGLAFALSLLMPSESFKKTSGLRCQNSGCILHIDRVFAFVRLVGGIGNLRMDCIL